MKLNQNYEKDLQKGMNEVRAMQISKLHEQRLVQLEKERSSLNQYAELKISNFYYYLT